MRSISAFGGFAGFEGTVALVGVDPSAGWLVFVVLSSVAIALVECSPAISNIHLTEHRGGDETLDFERRPRSRGLRETTWVSARRGSNGANYRENRRGTSARGSCASLRWRRQRRIPPTLPSVTAPAKNGRASGSEIKAMRTTPSATKSPTGCPVHKPAPYRPKGTTSNGPGSGLRRIDSRMLLGKLPVYKLIS